MSLTQAKKRLLEHLKRRGASTPGELGEALEITDVAARQHLQALAEDGHVQSAKRASSGRGRPAVEWSLTERGHGLFPDHHGELTVSLLDAARTAFGEDGVERLLSIRADEQTTAYRARMQDEKDLAGRLRVLAELRTDEGYMAEALVEEKPVEEPPEGQDVSGDSFLLIEHHCPICDAARACAGLCAKELEVFRRSLGPDVRVERTRHLLAGDARCVYRVQSADDD